MIHSSHRHCWLGQGAMYCTENGLVYIRPDQVEYRHSYNDRRDHFDVFARKARELSKSMRGIPVNGYVLVSDKFPLPKGEGDFASIIDLLRWHNQRCHEEAINRMLEDVEREMEQREDMRTGDGTPEAVPSEPPQGHPSEPVEVPAGTPRPEPVDQRSDRLDDARPPDAQGPDEPKARPSGRGKRKRA